MHKPYTPDKPDMDSRAREEQARITNPDARVKAKETGSTTMNRALAQRQSGIPTYDDRVQAPLSLPAVQRQCVTTWKQMEAFMPTFPDHVRKYCSKLWVWIERQPAGMRSPWMTPYLEGMRPYYTKLFEEARK